MPHMPLPQPPLPKRPRGQSALQLFRTDYSAALALQGVTGDRANPSKTVFWNAVHAEFDALSAERRALYEARSEGIRTLAEHQRLEDKRQQRKRTGTVVDSSHAQTVSIVPFACADSPLAEFERSACLSAIRGSPVFASKLEEYGGEPPSLKDSFHRASP